MISKLFFFSKKIWLQIKCLISKISLQFFFILKDWRDGESIKEKQSDLFKKINYLEQSLNKSKKNLEFLNIKGNVWIILIKKQPVIRVT